MMPLDPIVGGTALRIPAIQSPDFVTGVSGWIIRQDGSAEFHNILLTGGSLVVASAGQGVFVYSGTPGPGNPPVFSATSGTTDPYGNTVIPTLQIQGGGKLTVGAAGGPQVALLSNAAITVTTKMGATGSAASNVTSFGTLQQVVELPSNNVNEKSPAIIGQTLITYTGGETADAVLYLSGTTSTGTLRGTFRLDVCESSGLTYPQAVIEGVYTISGSAVTLSPSSFRGIAAGQIGIYNPTGVEGSSGVPVNALGGFTDGALYPSAMETWHSVAAGNGWTGTIYYKLTSDNEVYLWSNNLTAPASAANGVTIATLGSIYTPNVSMIFMIGATPNTGTWARMTLSNTGTLQTTGVLAGSGLVALDMRVPLDLP